MTQSKEIEGQDADVAYNGLDQVMCEVRSFRRSAGLTYVVSDETLRIWDDKLTNALNAMREYRAALRAGAPVKGAYGGDGRLDLEPIRKRLAATSSVSASKQDESLVTVAQWYRFRADMNRLLAEVERLRAALGEGAARGEDGDKGALFGWAVRGPIVWTVFTGPDAEEFVSDPTVRPSAKRVSLHFHDRAPLPAVAIEDAQERERLAHWLEKTVPLYLTDEEPCPDGIVLQLRKAASIVRHQQSGATPTGDVSLDDAFEVIDNSNVWVPKWAADRVVTFIRGTVLAALRDRESPTPPDTGNGQ